MSTPSQNPTESETPKPTHYKVICISMYTADIEQCDAKVADLKRRGLTKMSRSELIRIALANFKIEDIAREPILKGSS